MKKIIFLFIFLGAITGAYYWWGSVYGGSQAALDQEGSSLNLPLTGASSKNFNAGLCTPITTCPEMTYSYNIDPPQDGAMLQANIESSMTNAGYTVNTVQAPSGYSAFGTKENGKFTLTMTLASSTNNNQVTNAVVTVAYNPTVK